MQIGYFTERPYRWLLEEEVLKHRAFFAISNAQFDRERAADDYRYYLDEYCYAEDLGFAALALNEHHGNPICMGSVMNVEAAILVKRRLHLRSTGIAGRLHRGDLGAVIGHAALISSHRGLLTGSTEQAAPSMEHVRLGAFVR